MEIGTIRPRCPICYEPLESDATFSLPCGHTFDEFCIRKWLRDTSMCPTCRASDSSERLVKVHFDFSTETAASATNSKVHGKAVAKRIGEKKHARCEKVMGPDRLFGLSRQCVNLWGTFFLPLRPPCPVSTFTTGLRTPGSRQSLFQVVKVLTGLLWRSRYFWMVRTPTVQ